MGEWPKVIQAALQTGTLRAGDVVHFPPEAHYLVWGEALKILKWTFQVSSAASADRNYPGSVSGKLWRPDLARTGIEEVEVLAGTQRDICATLLAAADDKTQKSTTLWKR